MAFELVLAGFLVGFLADFLAGFSAGFSGFLFLFFDGFVVALGVEIGG